MTARHDDPADACAADHALVDFAHTPLRALLQHDGLRWEALDDDPQFLLTLPRAQPAGLYRITARVRSSSACPPCLYFDTGSGWGEASRVDLEQAPGAGHWWACVPLAAFSAEVRFDPADAPGGFEFAGVTLQRVSAGEHLVLRLDDAARRAPGSAARWLHEARVEVERGGADAAIHALPATTDAAWPGLDAEYRRWVSRFDALTESQVTALRDAVDVMPRRPLLSLVVPYEDGQATSVDALVQSLEQQIYPDWELCVVHRPGHGADHGARLAARSSRIRLLPMDALASGREALAAQGVHAARGAFVAVVDHRLRLAPHALLVMADAVGRSPGLQLLYADHDHLDAAGQRSRADFKPAWDPDLFLACDYLGPLVFHAADAPELERGRQPALRSLRERALALAARVRPTQVLHVPHVLAHVATGVAEATGDADASALVAHLARTEPGTHVDRVGDALRLRRPMPPRAPKVSIVIPTRDRRDLVERCVSSVLSLTRYDRYDVVVVDNQSVEPDTLAYFESLRGDPRVRVLAYDSPFNYSALNNHAVARVDGEVVALLNNDIEVISPDWLEEMLQYALRADVGAVGAMLYYPDDTIQHAGVVVGLGGVAGHARASEPRDVAARCPRARHVHTLSAVTAACLLVRRDAYLQVGGLDESLAVAFNDVDFCLRLGASGLRTVWTPFAEFYHHESASRGSEDNADKQARFAGEVEAMVRRWGDQLAADPYYNPNLSLLAGHAGALADPPRVLLADRVAAITARMPAHARVAADAEQVRTRTAS
ncbi:MAG TPA: glycosyltransferase family 2 protein [Luteimonas sp.]|nr:glycosyltransferase family 2 protein [Luteimonas sp.]